MIFYESIEVSMKNCLKISKLNENSNPSSLSIIKEYY